MKNTSLAARSLVLALALVSAALACSAPAVQSDVAPSGAVGEAFTVTPGNAALTPEVVVVTATPEPPLAAPPAVDSANAADSNPPATEESAPECAYDSVYVADLTIPDGTEMTGGTAFVKTWRVQNNGCQVWPDGTTLVYVSGKKMGGGAGVPVPQTAVSGTQDISINLTAPSAEGDAEGYWQLRTPDGIQFGDKLSVKIKVVAAPAPPAEDPSPTPTPKFLLVQPMVTFVLPASVSFNLTYAGVKNSCVLTGQQIWVRVKNTSTVKLESSYSRLEIPAGTTLNEGQTNNPFLPSYACGTAVTALSPGNIAWLVVGGSIKTFVKGTSGKITVKLCGLDDLDGFCATKSTTFTID